MSQLYGARSSQALCDYDYDEEFCEEYDDLDLKTIYQRGYSRWDENFLKTKAIADLSKISLFINLKSLEIVDFFPDSVLQTIAFPAKLQTFILECYYIKNTDLLNQIQLPSSICYLTLIHLNTTVIKADTLINKFHHQLGRVNKI